MERLIKPYITLKEVEAELREIFESGIFTKGRYVEMFKEGIKEYTGARYAFLTTSATTALWISLKAVGVKTGDEVIVSDFSFPATANVVEDIGATPVFADVDLETFNMMPAELEKKINKKTKAVIFVDALGNPSGILKIKKICKKNNIVLIEDAACAFGSSIGGRKCGNIADITCFSFHPRKVLTTGEGGAITTNSRGLAKFFEVKLNHGAVTQDSKFDFIDYGYNFRLSEIQAALGVKQIKKIDAIVKDRQAIKEEYRKCLEPHGFKTQRHDKNVVHNTQSVVFKTPENINRDDLIEHLEKNGIEATIGTYCLSGTTYYKGKYNQVLGNASFLERTTLTLPCFEGVNLEDILKAIYAFKKNVPL